MLKTDEKTGIVYRENTFDKWIINETRGYFPLGLVPQDVVLDIGGHIGAFAVRAKAEQAECEIVSLEPEESNYAVLAENAQKFGFEAMRSAAVAEDKHGQELQLYVNGKKNNATHSTVPVRGRATQTVGGTGFRTLIGAVQPTVVKCDIEGGEYDLNWDCLTQSPVRLVVMELHLTKKGHREAASALNAQLVQMGFQVKRAPIIGLSNWTALGSWSKM